ncbi:MAG: hypothetical protein M3Z08_16775 [Chloroflexota bacterium]|nr:hypothetical protein [Chloroflexota bacterium]
MEPVELYSSIAIPHDELVAFLLQNSVERLGQSPHLDYRLGRGEAYVLFELDSDEEHYPDPEFDALLESKLGGPPQTSFLIYISRNEGSEQLAMDFVTLFAQLWPCVLDNLSGRARQVFTPQEVQVLRQEGRGLYEEANKIPLPVDEYEGEAFIPPRREGEEEGFGDEGGENKGFEGEGDEEEEIEDEP